MSLKKQLKSVSEEAENLNASIQELLVRGDFSIKNVDTHTVMIEVQGIEVEIWVANYDYGVKYYSHSHSTTLALIGFTKDIYGKNRLKIWNEINRKHKINPPNPI